MTDEQFQALLTAFTKRLKQMRVLPGVIPNEVLRDIVEGKVVLVVYRLPHSTWAMIRGYYKPHPTERLFENIKQ